MCDSGSAVIRDVSGPVDDPASIQCCVAQVEVDWDVNLAPKAELVDKVTFLCDEDVHCHHLTCGCNEPVNGAKFEWSTVSATQL